MKEHPILFSAAMVRAILEDRKTQTRRVMKPQPILVDGEWRFAGAGWTGSKDVALFLPGHSLANRFPYGQIGDRLWVKETFGVHDTITTTPNDLPNFKSEDGRYHPVIHFAGKENYAWGMYGPPRKRSSRFMPKSVARIWLEIVDVRVERVQRISQADAKAEGVRALKLEDGGFIPLCGSDYVGAYRNLWNELNAKRGYGWDVNPWVWVIEFKRIDSGVCSLGHDMSEGGA